MCYPNGTCDPELECDPGSSMCIPQGCTPGALECACMDGTCTHPWICEGGICLDDSEGSTGGASTSGTDASSDAGVTSGGVTSVDATSDGHDSESTTEGENPCASQTDCSSCLTCASQGGPCAQPYAECTSMGEKCTDPMSCQANCAFFHACDSQCCEGVDADAAQAADAVTACRMEICSAACRADLGYPGCSG
jgi:hypothetical protein